MLLWLKFNNLNVALVMTLTFYTSVVKGLKLRIRKFWRLILTLGEVVGKKIVERPFYRPSLPHPPILNRVKILKKRPQFWWSPKIKNNYISFLLRICIFLMINLISVRFYGKLLLLSTKTWLLNRNFIDKSST